MPYRRLTTLGVAALLATLSLLPVAPAAHAETVSFGNYDALPDISNHSLDYLLGTRIAVTQPITVQKAGIFFYNHGEDFHANVGLYSDLAGAPGALLAQTGAFTVTTAGRVETAFQTLPTLAPGNYWFMAIFDAEAHVGIAYDDTTPDAYQPLPFTADLPTAFGPPQTYLGQDFNYYLTGDPTPESTPTPTPAAAPAALTLLGAVALRRQRPRVARL